MGSSEGVSTRDSWASAFKNQILWFVFAILLAAGTTYFQVTLSITTVEQNLANAEDKIQELEDTQEDIDDAREELRIIINNLDSKVNALLRENGIDPSTLERFRNNRNEQLNNEQ